MEYFVVISLNYLLPTRSPTLVGMSDFGFAYLAICLVYIIIFILSMGPNMATRAANTALNSLT